VSTWQCIWFSFGAFNPAGKIRKFWEKTLIVRISWHHSRTVFYRGRKNRSKLTQQVENRPSCRREGTPCRLSPCLLVHSSSFPRGKHGALVLAGFFISQPIHNIALPSHWPTKKVHFKGWLFTFFGSLLNFCLMFSLFSVSNHSGGKLKGKGSERFAKMELASSNF